MYNLNAVQGTGVVAPKQVAVPSGIQFVNGVPQIISSALQARQSSVGQTGSNQPTTGVAPSTKTIPSQQSVAVNPSKPAVPAKPTTATTGASTFN